MRWKDVNLNPDLRVLRQFGGICTLFCAGTAIWQFAVLRRPVPGIAWGCGSVLFLILALVYPNLLRGVFITSIVVTFPVGWAVSNLVLFLLYFGLMTPLAVVFRCSGRDLLQLKRPLDSDTSFWSSKEIDRDKRSYFKQF